MRFYDILLLLASVFLIIVIVLQDSKDNAASAFSGEKSEQLANQKQRGAEKVISNVTAVLSVAFFVLAAVASFVSRT